MEINFDYFCVITIKHTTDMVTKISAIIEAYLQRENRLIIPNVGTLLKRKESGEIVFVEMLKKDDGKLKALVATDLAIDADEAAAIVEGYAEEIGRQIATSRKFIIDGVGVLLVGANGALDFAFNPYSHTIPEPEARVAATEVKEVAPEVKAVAPEVKPTVEKAAEPEVEKVAEPEVKPVVEKVAEPKVVVEVLDDEDDDEPQPVKPAAPAQVRTAPVAATRKQVALYEDDDDEDDAPQQTPRKIKIRRPAPRKRVDPLTVIAIVAVVLAVITLCGSFFIDNESLDVDATEQYEMGSDFLLEEE